MADQLTDAEAAWQSWSREFARPLLTMAQNDETPSLASLAAAIGTTRQTLHGIWTGKRPMTPATFTRIYHLLAERRNRGKL